MKDKNRVISLDEKVRDNYLALYLAICYQKKKNGESYSVNEACKMMKL